jgi:hypothetical protein
MARVRFIGPEPVTVPELQSRVIQPDDVVQVPDARFWGYVCQPCTWESVEEPPGFVIPGSEPEEPAERTAAKKTAAKPQKGD